MDRLLPFLNKYWYVGLITGFLIGAALLENRSFVMGYICALFFVVFHLRFRNITINGMLVAFVALLIVLICLVCFVKSDSSKGRLLVYKITAKILDDHYVKGIGSGNFGYVYGHYQLNYFKKGHYSEKELLLADNTVHAYNDYLQFIVEQGLLGLLGLAAVMFFLYISIVRSYAYHLTKPSLLLFAICHIIGIAVAAFFSPVFEKIYWQFIFVASLAIIIYYSKGRVWKYVFSVVFLIFISVIFIRASHHFFILSSLKRYEETKELERAGFHREANALYFSLYPKLSDRAEFLRDFAKNLLVVKEYEKSLEVAKLLIGKENVSMNFQILAECYYNLSLFPASEEEYRNAIYRVPNRFGTRYELFSFYLNTNETRKAQLMAFEILHLPVKVPSERVEQIKASVTKFLSLSD